jgi:hypothetical protein
MVAGSFFALQYDDVMKLNFGTQAAEAVVANVALSSIVQDVLEAGILGPAVR